MAALSGKKALVLCGSGGIGFGIASELLNGGARVAVTGRSLERLLEARNLMPIEEAIQVDHAVPGATAPVVEKLLEKWGGLDILILHSPAPRKGRVEFLKPEDWSDGFQKLFLAPLEALQAALPALKRSLSPRVVFVLSTAAREPIPGLPISSALRAGLVSLCKSLSREWAEDQITVNALLPGYTRSSDPIVTAGAGHLEQSVPLKRLAEPFEHGRLVAFLASPESSYITGQAIAVDGGLLRSSS
jgi:3-oxoacyl-[acyl-carrier protein] reductase